MSRKNRSPVPGARNQNRARNWSAEESQYRAILREQPDNVEAIRKLAVLCHKDGRSEEALALFRRAIALDPDSPIADVQLGRLLEQRGAPAEAAICYRRATRLRPLDADAEAGLARVLAAQADGVEALPHFRRAAALAPADPWNHIALGNALLREGSLSDALASYQQALAISPDLAEAHNNLGETLRRLGRPAEAIAACERALALNPELPEAHNNLGNALLEERLPGQAIPHFQQALLLKPGWPEVHHNLALALQEQGSAAEAVRHAELAAALNPGLAEAHQNLGNILAQCGQMAEAAAALQRALALRPGYPEALVQLAQWNAELCDWRGREEEEMQVLDLMRRHPGLVPPFNLYAQTSTPAEQLLCARQWSGRFAPAPVPALAHHRPPSLRKIRVGYLSADFRDHPVAYAIAEIIERHDRSRFEVFGYSYGPHDGSPLRQRLETAFDCFVDLEDVGDEPAAHRIHSDQVHVLIDLTGYTRLCRPRIPASRPAPIQINFLGLLGTMGADFIDYIIADAFLAPFSQQEFYSEKLIHLPNGWWPAEIQWEIAPDARTRAHYNLPDQAFVFCCFNSSYKFAPPLFDVWARLLQAHPHAVLWLGASGSATQDNLRREAAQRGVAPQRVIFAPQEPMPEYLARHRHADLFLDTLPYNAVGTAYHALLAGLPVLTYAGDTFAGRTAGSMLLAAGLPELVTHSIDEYEHSSTRLMREPGLLAGIRRKLANAPSSAPLFHPQRAVRELESAYAQACENWLKGEPPRPFTVPG